ncbi:MAG: hypothetical protein WDM76_08990 [Limisphaerales bacterium]
MGLEWLADLVRRGNGILYRWLELGRQAGSFRGPIPYWPVLLLCAPIILAMLMNTGDARATALWVSLIFALWVVRCARTIFQVGEMNVKRIVSGLLAGIMFVDWLAVAPQFPREVGVVFLILFGVTLLAQRFIPAT